MFTTVLWGLCCYYLYFIDEEETEVKKVKSLDQMYTTIKWESWISDGGSLAGSCLTDVLCKWVNLMCLNMQCEGEREQEWRTSEVIFYWHVESEIKYDRPKFPKGRGHVCFPCSVWYLWLLVVPAHSRSSSIPGNGGGKKGGTEPGRKRDWMNKHN